MKPLPRGKRERTAGAGRSAIVMAALCLGIAIQSCSSIKENESPVVPDRFTPRELQADFMTFRRSLEREAAALYADKARLSSMLDDAGLSLGEPMSELEFYRLLAPVVAELRCGHSSLSLSKATETRHRDEALYFPLGVRIYGDRLFTYEDRHATGVLPGSEILAIDGRPAVDIVSAIMSRMTTDGSDRGRPRYDAERWFAAMYHDYIDAPDAFELTARQPGDASPRSLRVAAARDASLAKTPSGILRDTLDAPYSGYIADGVAVLTIPCFGIRDARTYAAWLKEYFAEARNQEAGALIIDLRGNYGGSPPPTVELFKYLIDRPIPFFSRDNPIYINPWKKPVQPSPLRFRGDLYVLMDEAGFSMNAFLLSLLQYHGIGTLIGSRSSGGFRCSDATVQVTLKATGLRLAYSTRVFSVAVEGMRPGEGVEPDLEVSPTLDDWIAGRDPAMEAALALAAARGRR